MTTTGARIPPADLTGVQGRLVSLLARRMLGKVPESMGVMWHHPRIFKDFFALGRKSDRWEELDGDLAAYASMTAAATVGCSFCLDLHYFLVHTKGLSEAKAREVTRWRTSEVFTPVERRVMEYAEAMSQTPPAVSDELSAQLLEDLGPAALLELTARVAMMNLNARTNVTLGIRSEGLAASCGLPPLEPGDLPRADLAS